MWELLLKVDLTKGNDILEEDTWSEIGKIFRYDLLTYIYGLWIATCIGKITFNVMQNINKAQ